MPGTKQGGKNAARTNKRKYGRNFYARIGQLGGKSSRNGGFASKKIGRDGLTGRQRASVAGFKGGSISSRSGIVNKVKEV